MKPALYIDFDGTLTTDKYWRSLPEPYHGQVQDLLFGADRSLVTKWMRGGHTAEEINSVVADHIDWESDKLWELFIEDCESMTISNELLGVIGGLKSRYTTVLMTINMDSFSRFTVPALKLDQYFDHISNSYHEQLFKSDNDGELFARWSTKLGVPISESILVDDSLKNCELFEALGGQAMVTKSPTETLMHLRSL